MHSIRNLEDWFMREVRMTSKPPSLRTSDVGLALLLLKGVVLNTHSSKVVAVSRL